MIIILLQLHTMSIRITKARQHKSFVNHSHVLLVAYIDFVNVFFKEGTSIFSKNSKVKHLIQVEEG